MNTPPHMHPEEHEQLLHTHLAGDLADDDPRLVGRLRECPTCRARLGELRSLTSLLEHVGEDQRRSLAELPDPASAPGAERVATTLRALAAGQAPARPRPLAAAPREPGPRSVTLWRVSLAAASVLAAGWVVKALLPPGEGPEPDVTLGESRRSTLTPADKAIVDQFGRFTWRDESARSRHYLLSIWAAGTHLTAEPLLTDTPRDNSWEPTPDQLAKLTDAIRWEIVGYDDLGQACFSDSATVTRRRP